MDSMFDISKFDKKRTVELEVELANIIYEIKKIDLEIADYEKREANAELEIVNSGLTGEEFEKLTNDLLEKNLSDEEYDDILERIHSLPKDEEDKVALDDDDFIVFVVVTMGFYRLRINDLRKKKLKLLETELEIHEELIQEMGGENLK